MSEINKQNIFVLHYELDEPLVYVTLNIQSFGRGLFRFSEAHFDSDNMQISSPSLCKHLQQHLSQVGHPGLKLNSKEQNSVRPCVYNNHHWILIVQGLPINLCRFWYTADTGHLAF